MYNKLKFFALLFCFSAISTHAQSIQLVIDPNPSPYISDWQSRATTFTLIINNSSSTNLKVKVSTELYDGKSALVANTNASKMPVLVVPPGINQYSPEDIFPLYAVNYKGNVERTATQTGRIPDDNYRFCVSITDPITNIQIGGSNTVCKMFNIIAYQAPILQTPKDNDIISAKNIKGIVFRWTPISPSPKMIVTYRLQVFEVLPGQENMTALRSNLPIIEKDLRGVLQTQWPIDFAMPEAGKKYVWTVTPLDVEGKKLVDGYGFAQPFAFRILVVDATPGCFQLDTTQYKVVCNGVDSLGRNKYKITNLILTNVGTNPGRTGLYNSTISDIITPTGFVVQNITPTGGASIAAGASVPISFDIIGASGSTATFFVNANIPDPLMPPVHCDEVIGVIIDLPQCKCSACDSIDVQFNQFTETNNAGNNNQYNIAGNIVCNRPIYGIEFQVQSYSYNATPTMCTNGVNNLEQSGVFLLPGTTINNAIPYIYNTTTAGANNNASKDIKLTSSSALSGNIPINLLVGLPGPLTGLGTNCCTLNYTVCIKAIVFYEKNSCKSCVFNHCFSFTNK